MFDLRIFLVCYFYKWQILSRLKNLLNSHGEWNEILKIFARDGHKLNWHHKKGSKILKLLKILVKLENNFKIS